MNNPTARQITVARMAREAMADSKPAVKIIVKRWYYAVMVEEGITWSTAVRAKDEQAARRELGQRYPHATVFNITR